MYATPNEFMVKRVGPKHGAKGKLGRWLPNRLKPKGVRKKEVLAIRHSGARKEIYAKKTKAAKIKKIEQTRDTTGRLDRMLKKIDTDEWDSFMSTDSDLSYRDWEKIQRRQAQKAQRPAQKR